MEEIKTEDILVKDIETKNIMTKSNLPVGGYSVNPYVGCTHACKYCYASFMKRFTGHIEEYGNIYAKAFSGEPWNDPWKAGDAVIHIKELLESKQASVI